MKKTLKKLFSRFSFVALTILLLLAFVLFLIFGGLAALQYVVARYVPSAAFYVNLGLTVLSWFFVFCCVLHAANRDMVPETKILCIVALHVFGATIYIMFSSNRPSRRKRILYRKLNERSRPFETDVADRARFEKEAGRWVKDSDALRLENPSAVVLDGTKTEYLARGEIFAERLLHDLNAAKKFIFLEFFIIGKGKLWNWVLSVLVRKAAEGVEVRVMYDDIGSMSRVHVRYHKTLQKLGIRCVKFNPFVPVITNVHNNRDHRKIVVIDGVVGYTGGINLADEYVNLEHPFGDWKDSAIRLEGKGVRSLTLMFLRLYDTQRRQTEDFSPYIPQSFPYFEGAGFVQPYGDGPAPLFGRHIAENVYINILNGARDYVYINTPYLIIDYRMREALISAAKRGVDVRLVVPAVPDKKIAYALTRSNYLALI